MFHRISIGRISGLHVYIALYVPIPSPGVHGDVINSSSSSPFRQNLALGIYVSPLVVFCFSIQRNIVCIAMFQNILRHLQAPALSTSHLPNRRPFSYVSRHSDFPASLYQFQIHRDSRLYDRAFKQDDWEYEDGIEVTADGLVHPNITPDCMRTQLHIIDLLTYSVSNGALFMPNTRYMQEITRRSNDYYLEDVESGKPAAEAHYLCIPKGD